MGNQRFGSYLLSKYHHVRRLHFEVLSDEHTIILQGHKRRVTSVAISPDSSYIVSGSWDRDLRIWKKDGTAVATLKGHTRAVQCIVMSSDGYWFVSGSADKTLRIWVSDLSRIKRDFVCES